METLKLKFTEVLNAFSARMGKEVKSRRLEGTIICPVFYKNHVAVIQSPKQIEELLKGNQVYIEAPADLKADLLGLNDPFAWMQRKFGLIEAVLTELLDMSQKTIFIRTSSDWVAMDTNCELLKKLSDKHDVTIELTYAWGCDADSARFLMPSCPNEKRLNNAFDILKQHKLNVKKVGLGA